ncbi:hypothetical protein [Variovorax sp. V512]|uniref:hypothetical protein n=1 Tax=Variovorax sp. V512 TaxID=3064160 RepID=UPI0034E8F5B5
MLELLLGLVRQTTQHQMNGRKVEVEHPRKPDSGIVVILLLVILMPNLEIVGNIEKISFVSLCNDVSHFGAQQLKNSGQIAYGMSAIID